MVRITEELVRKKSEHNECIINSLEELSLHQENIEKIELLNNWCRNLEILLLQSNLISKIGDLESVTSLKNNRALSCLYLTGNPCTDYKDYRNYVISQLPQLECLDNNEVTRTERLKALQVKESFAIGIKDSQRKYFQFRKQQQERLTRSNDQNLDDEAFWRSKSEHAPETRIEIANRTMKARSTNKSKDIPTKRTVNFHTKDGRPLNMNQGKLKFRLEEEPKEFRLEIAVYKYLDTNLISMDLEPDYVRVSIKDKIFQYVLSEEICVDKSKVERSQTTGYLLITMPKINYKEPLHFDKPRYCDCSRDQSAVRNTNFPSAQVKEDADSDLPALEYG